MSSNFENEMRYAYIETMTGRIGLALVLVTLFICASIVSHRYLDLKSPNPCEICLENHGDTWDCDDWAAGEPKSLCMAARQKEMQQCMQICDKPTKVEKEPK